MNSLYSQLMGDNKPTSDYKSTFDMIRNSSNPNQLLADIINQNPKARELFLNMLKSGKSPKDYFIDLVNAQGIDPGSILNKIC